MKHWKHYHFIPMLLIREGLPQPTVRVCSNLVVTCEIGSIVKGGGSLFSQESMQYQGENDFAALG